MSQLKWNSVSADFSGANQAMNASTNALSSAGDIFGKLTNQIEQQKQNDLDEAFRQESFRLQEQQAIRQQEQHDLAMLNEKESMEAADLVRQWDKEFLNPDGTYNIVAMGEVASQAEFATSGASQYIANELQKRLGINFNYEQMRSENAAKLLKTSQDKNNAYVNAFSGDILNRYQQALLDKPNMTMSEYTRSLAESKIDSERELASIISGNAEIQAKIQEDAVPLFEKSSVRFDKDQKEKAEKAKTYIKENKITSENSLEIATTINDMLSGNRGWFEIDDISTQSLRASLGAIANSDQTSILTKDVIMNTIGAMAQVNPETFTEDDLELKDHLAEDLNTLIEDRNSNKPNEMLGLMYLSALKDGKTLSTNDLAWLEEHHPTFVTVRKNGDSEEITGNPFDSVVQRMLDEETNKTKDNNYGSPSILKHTGLPR